MISIRLAEGKSCIDENVWAVLDISAYIVCQSSKEGEKVAKKKREQELLQQAVKIFRFFLYATDDMFMSYEPNCK